MSADSTSSRPERKKPVFANPPVRHWTDPVIDGLRNDRFVVAGYTWVTETLVPFVLLIVVVLPVGAVLLVFYLPKFYRNWKRRRRYGVEIAAGTWATEPAKAQSSPSPSSPSLTT